MPEIPALTLIDVRRMTIRSGGATRGYVDLPKVLSPLFFQQVDQDAPVFVLRTHTETATSHTGDRIDLLVAICSFAPKTEGPRLLNELLCLPDDFGAAVTTIEHSETMTSEDLAVLKVWGMHGPSSANSYGTP